MAKRRMFSKEITDSDKFLDMSKAAQLLYFHLGLNGDDDGFVGNPKNIMRSLGFNKKTLSELIDIGFVIPFESGVIVITHWMLHNYIQKDRYHKTIYQQEFESLECNKGTYTLKK